MGNGKPSSHIASAYLTFPVRSFARAITVSKRRFMRLPACEEIKVREDKIGEDASVITTRAAA